MNCASQQMMTSVFMLQKLSSTSHRLDTHQCSFRGLCGQVDRFPLQSLKHAEHIDGQLAELHLKNKENTDIILFLETCKFEVFV